jgi:hypothetical protein
LESQRTYFFRLSTSICFPRTMHARSCTRTWARMCIRSAQEGPRAGALQRLVPSNERLQLRAATARGTSTAACDGGIGQEGSRTAGRQSPLRRPAWACSRATHSTTACGDPAAKSPTEPLGSPPTAFQTCGPGPRSSATQTYPGWACRLELGPQRSAAAADPLPMPKSGVNELDFFLTTFQAFAPPGWATDTLMVGIRSPDGLVVGSCTSHPGVLSSIPKREEPGKTGRHPVLKYRVPHGSHRTVCYRIPRTLTPPCGLLRSAKLKAVGNNKLTIRTFLFSPPL